MLSTGKVRRDVKISKDVILEEKIPIITRSNGVENVKLMVGVAKELKN